MNLLLTRYASTLTLRYAARDAGNFELEEQFLDRLDQLWLEMSDTERRACDEVARATKQRHRMQKNFLSTSFHFDCYSGASDVVGKNSFYTMMWSPDSCPAQNSSTARVNEVKRQYLKPMKSSSSAPALLEPQVAYG